MLYTRWKDSCRDAHYPLSIVIVIQDPNCPNCIHCTCPVGTSNTVLRVALLSAGGRIAGEVRINGYPQEQKTWARVSGYVEQSDIHSPQATVEEALWFSARLRLTRETSNKVMWAFIYEVSPSVLS